MHTIKLLCKMSLQYWRKHKVRFAVFFLTVVLGTAALYCAALLVRSNKDAVLEDELVLLGNYDIDIYGISASSLDELEEISGVDTVGSYLELGYVSLQEVQSLKKTACFDNTTSEDMYHMTCSDGCYPTEENEIAIDINTAKTLGVEPKLGETITLDMYDLNEEYIGSQEFIIVGLFEASSIDSYGGWYRYPQNYDINEYDMPGIFMYNQMNDIFQSEECVALIQSAEDDLYILADDIYNELQDEIDYNQINVLPSGRRYAYSYVLGIMDTIYEEYGDMSFSSIAAAVKDENVIKDFYSGILIPVFGILIFIIAFVSLLGVMRDIVGDKREQMGVLRSIGVSGKTTAVYFFMDFLILTLAGILFGLALGAGIHVLMIVILNTCCHMNINFGFAVSIYVASATVNPLIYSICIVLVCFLMASVRPIYSVATKTPAYLLRGTHQGAKVKRRTHAVRIKSWRQLLKNRMGLFYGSVVIISMLVMGTLTFGYVYFCALSDSGNGDLLYQKEEMGLANYDYAATISDYVDMYTFNIENKHSYGISEEIYNTIIDHDYIENADAVIVNKSTRLTYQSDSISGALLEIFANMSLGIEETDADGYEADIVDAQKAMISAIGYDPDDYIYSLPTVGLTDEDLNTFYLEVLDGEICEDAIRSGEEIILAVPESYASDVLNCFHAGDSLPLSDILLSEEEEDYDFTNFTEIYDLDPVYEKDITLDDGSVVPLTSYAIGSRKDIETKIGAIVVINDDFLENNFPALSDYVGVYDDESAYGLYAVCLTDTFANWGLPDTNFTSVKIEVKDEADLDEVDKDWYQELSQTTGISISSAKEIYDAIDEGRTKNLSIYYMMFALLLMIGMIASAICLYSRLRLKSQEFAYMKAVGLTNNSIYGLILKENMIYSVVGAVFSVVPVCLCQIFFVYIRKMVDSGAWDGISTGATPWYHDLPYRYNLYEYQLGTVIILVFIIHFALMILASVPGLIHIKNQDIVKEFETNTF